MTRRLESLFSFDGRHGRPVHRRRRMATGSALAIMLATPLFGAAAVDEKTPEELADTWAEKQGFTRDAIPELIEEVSKPMDAIIQTVAKTVQHGSALNHYRPCGKAALRRAAYIAIEGTYSRKLRGALQTGIDAALAVPDAAKSLAAFLRDKSKEEIEKFILGKLSEQAPEAYRNDVTEGKCKTSMRIVWNKKKHRYAAFFAGNCGCEKVVYNVKGARVEVKTKVRLRGWTATAEGRIRASVGSDGKPKFKVLPFSTERASKSKGKLTVKADCNCDKRTAFYMWDPYPDGDYCSLWPEEDEAPFEEEGLVLATLADDRLHPELFGSDSTSDIDAPIPFDLVQEDFQDGFPTGIPDLGDEPDFEPAFELPRFDAAAPEFVSDLVWAWAAFLVERYGSPEMSVTVSSELDPTVFDDPGSVSLTDAVQALADLFVAEEARWLTKLAELSPEPTFDERAEIAGDIVEAQILGITEREFLPMFVGFDASAPNPGATPLDESSLYVLDAIVGSVWEQRFGIGPEYCPPEADSPWAILTAVAGTPSGAVGSEDSALSGTSLSRDPTEPLYDDPRTVLGPTPASKIVDLSREDPVSRLEAPHGTAQKIPTTEEAVLEEPLAGGVAGATLAAYLALHGIPDAIPTTPLPDFLGGDELEAIESVTLGSLIRRHSQVSTDGVPMVPFPDNPALLESAGFDSLIGQDFPNLGVRPQ